MLHIKLDGKSKTICGLQYTPKSKRNVPESDKVLCTDSSVFTIPVKDGELLGYTLCEECNNGINKYVIVNVLQDETY